MSNSVESLRLTVSRRCFSDLPFLPWNVELITVDSIEKMKTNRVLIMKVIALHALAVKKYHRKIVTTNSI